MALPFVSCQKSDIGEESTQNAGNNGGGSGGGVNNGGNTNYYFHFSSLGANLHRQAGSTFIYFESNTNWTVTLDKSHFGASAQVYPVSGYGKGGVIVSYGEESNHYDCSDYLKVSFRYIDKINPDGSAHYDVNTYTITRRYHHIQP